mgnify:CR=1 FL=1
MKLTRIDSTNARQPSWQILKEWEEVLSQKTGLPVYRDNRLIRYIKAHFDKWGMSFLWKILVTRKNLGLRFIMNAQDIKVCDINKIHYSCYYRFLAKKKNNYPLFMWLTKKFH